MTVASRSRGIATIKITGYNLQPNKSSMQGLFAGSAFIWLGIQEDGHMPIFFLLNGF
jgi:hypothetical protein